MKKTEKEKLEKAKVAARKKVEEEKAKQAEASASRVGITKPGIIDEIVAIIKQYGPIGKKKIHNHLVKKFADREPEKMMKTVNCQIGGKKRPLRIEASRNIELEVTDKGLYSYKGEAGEKKKTKKSSPKKSSKKSSKKKKK